MQLFTNKYDFKQLYSSSSKLIISARDENTFLKVLNISDQIDIYKFRFDRQTSKGTITLLQNELNNKLNNDLNLVEMQLAPNFCLGLPVFSEAAKKELTKLICWWSEKSLAESIPKFIEFPQEQEACQLKAEFWRQMYATSVQQTQAIAQRIGTLQKQYLGLRTLHENMQNAFATVEDYLTQAKLPPIQLVFDAQVTNRLIEPSTVTNSNSLILKQLLPISSRGLAIIELHVGKKYANASGYLKIDLKACEDITSLAAWQISYPQLSDGWLSLDLPSIDLGRKRDVELIIEWHTELGPAPALSLSKLQLIPEARAYTDNLALEQSLALRIWHGLPGTRKVTSPYLMQTINGQKQLPIPQLGYLGQGAMAKVIEVTPNLPEEDFAHIQVLDRGAKILTHPRADGTPTVAMLRFCFPPTANQLTASIVTEHESAGIIEYAMAIVEPETEPINYLTDESALAFSDWIAVEANTPQQITLNMDSPAREHCHIVIATKLAQGSPSDYAWSHWLNFHSAVQTKQPATSLRETTQKIIITQGQTQLKDVSLNLSEDGFAKVQLIENEGKIQVHPSYDGDTVAVLANVIPRGTTKVISTVCTENEAASVIEYAIAIMATDDDDAARLVVSSPQSALGFSGWQRVEPNTLFKLEVDLVVPAEDSYHVVLATRIPEDGHQSCAWARWLDLQCVVCSTSQTKALVTDYSAACPRMGVKRRSLL